VIKWLILDCGFIDGERISRGKRDWGIGVLIPMKKNMDIWADAWALAPQGSWQRRPEPTPSIPQIPPQRPELIRRREAKRQKKLARWRAQQPPAWPDLESGPRRSAELSSETLPAYMRHIPSPTV
jgi:hypothetical protein